MKKKIIMGIITVLICITTIIIPKRINKNKYTVETYIDGVLAKSMPEANSGYKVSNITCNNGVNATFNYASWRLDVSNITSNTFCKIEFTTNNNTNFNTYLKNKVCSKTSANLTDDEAKDCLVNENGYRYEGEDPNNFVLFNDELWRIIGVFNVTNSAGTTEDLVKLIRYETLDSLAWHRTSTNGNDWTNAELKNTLNNGYLNATDETCYVYQSNTKTCKFSKTGIKAGARSKIESVVWHLGGRVDNSATADTFYSAERGSTGANGTTDTAKLTWTGKVGLMYPSDYGYAVLAKNCARTTNLGSYSSSSCMGKDWLKKGSYQWTITPRSSGASGAFGVGNGGGLLSNGVTNGYGGSPSIYLKSGVQYMSGTGEYSNPYVVS